MLENSHSDRTFSKSLSRIHAKAALRDAAHDRLLAELPPRDTVRWVSRRKAAVVEAVQNGVLSLSDACERYNLSVEEYLSWERAVERHGMEGLRITHAQEYRGQRRK